MNTEITNEQLQKLSLSLSKSNEIKLVSGLTTRLDVIFKNKSKYSKISTNKQLALDKTFIVLSNLTSTIFREDSDSYWKNLNSNLLLTQVGVSYSAILKLLSYHSIIDIDLAYSVGEHSRAYKLTNECLSDKVVVYKIKSQTIINQRNAEFFEELKGVLKNTIANNLVHIYPSLELPTISEIEAEGKRLHKLKAKTSKGKTITFDVKRNKDKFSKDVERSFVSDAIKRFKYLTESGFVIPKKGSERSGGRVVDSFNLCNKWIRNLIKIDGKKLVELDFSCLHPNISNQIYGGTGNNITHKIVAEYLNIDIKEAKVLNLTFFNLEPVVMKSSKLYNYYADNEPVMLSNILQDKNNQSFEKHKNKSRRFPITSTRMFSTEVLLMTKILEELNNTGIYALYIYDALMFQEDDIKEAKEVMNRIAAQMGINTTI